MNKKIIKQVGIAAFIMIIVSVILVTTNFVPGQYLDKIITGTACIIGLIRFLNSRKAKKKDYN